MDEAQHLVERERWFKWHVGGLLVAVGVGLLQALLRIPALIIAGGLVLSFACWAAVKAGRSFPHWCYESREMWLSQEERRQEDDVWMRIGVFIGIGIAMYGVSAVVGGMPAALGF
jgi:hypothetical protein